MVTVVLAAAVGAGVITAAAGIHRVPGPVFVLATSVGIGLGATLLAARAQHRQHAGRHAAVGLIAACLLGAAAAIIDFTGRNRFEWLWIALGTATAATACLATWDAWRAERHAGHAGDAPFAEEPPPGINPETVEVGLENARWVLADEQARGQSLQTRASGLAGFAGIIISLLAAAVVTAAQRHDLTEGQRTVVTAFLAYGLVLLIAAIAMLLLGVLATRQIEVTAVSELELYAKRTFMTHSPAWAQGRITSTLVKALAAERAQNNRRVRWLNSGATAVVAALVFVAAGAVTLLL